MFTIITLNISSWFQQKDHGFSIDTRPGLDFFSLAYRSVLVNFSLVPRSSLVRLSLLIR